MSTGIAANPFKGLDPYLPGERLFGRDADMLLLKDRIFRGKTTLLFAGSGVGKTSFLRAKVIPEIEQRYREQFIVRYHREWAGKDPLSALKTALGAQAAESLPDFFRRNSGSGSETWLVVLDQFEELFQYHVYLAYFDAFRNELSAAISAPDTPVRFIFSMREEFLGQLSAFDNRVPDLFANYFRLKNPDRHQTEEIIGMTSEGAGVQVDETGLGALIDDLSCVEFRGPGGRTRRFRRDFVILPHLQLVCRGLWDENGWRRPDTQPRFLSDYAKKARSGKDNPARKALRMFCSGCMEALTPEQQRIAARAFDFLVTSQGAKMPYELKNLARHMSVAEDELEGTLLKLSREARILKHTEWQTERWYELYHDMYAPVIYEWKEQFDARLQSEQAEESRAAVYDRRAVQAETRENSEEALLLRLKALDTRDTEMRRRQAARLLDGMAALTMAFRHDGPILAIAPRADSKQVVTASFINPVESVEPDKKSAKKTRDRSLIQVWDAETGAPIGKPIEVEGAIRALAVNADSTLVAAAVEGAVYLVAPGGSVAPRRVSLREKHNRPQAQERLRFSSDGRFLTLEKRLPAALWGVLVLGRAARFRWSTIRGRMLAFDGAAEIAAVQRENQTLIVANPNSGKVIANLHMDEPITAFAFNPNGKHLAVATKDGVVTIWRTADGRLEDRQFRFGGSVRRIGFGDTRLSILYLTDRGPEWQSGVMQTWELGTGEPVGSPIPIAARRMLYPIFSPNAGFVLIRRPGGRPAAIANTQTSALLEVPSGGQSHNRSEWSADDRLLLTGGKDGTVRAWSPSQLRGISPPLAHPSGIRSAALNPATLRVALVAGDGSTCIRATDGRSIRELPGRARFVAWDRRGAQLAVVSDDGFVRVLSAATGEEQARIRAADTDKVIFGATGNGAVLINTFISARWFQWGDGKPRSRALPAAGDAVFSRNGRVFVPYSNDEQASGVWDARTGKRTAAFRHDGGIQTIAVSPDGKLVLSGGNDGRALLWSSTDGDRLAVLPHQGPVVQAALSSSGRYAATLGTDQVARVWSLPEGREIGRIRYEGSALTLSFTPDDQLLFIASANWAHLFRIEGEMIPYASRRLLGRWSGEYRFLERDGSRLLALTSTGELGYQADVIRFDIVAAEPVNRMPSLEAWEQRTALRFEGEELVPRALARAVVPIVQSAAAGRTPQPESEPAL